MIGRTGQVRAAGLCAGLVVAAVAAAVTAASEPRSGRNVRVEHRLSPMVPIPAGTFLMGFSESELDKADLALACARELGAEVAEALCRPEALWGNAIEARAVYLPAFEIDRYEVTVAAFRACAADGGCDVTALASGDRSYLADALPMVNVTWQDAVDHCGWVGKRLPSEAEWEKAARGSDGRRWPWGNFARADGANHGKAEQDPVRGARVPLSFAADASDGHRYAASPGTLLWSDSAYGVYDLAGNVSEWVADYYREDYVGLPTVAPRVDTPPAGNYSMRVYRGGSWAEPMMFGRAYMRLYADPEHRSFDRGFRCARDASKG